MQSYDEVTSLHFSTELLDQLTCCCRCPACRQEIIDDSDFLTRCDPTDLDSLGIGSILEVVALFDHCTRELATFSDHDEWLMELLCDCCPEDKSSRIESHNHIGILRFASELLDCVTQCCRVVEQRTDIFEKYSLFGEIGDIADIVMEINRWLVGI